MVKVLMCLIALLAAQGCSTHATRNEDKFPRWLVNLQFLINGQLRYVDEKPSVVMSEFRNAIGSMSPEARLDLLSEVDAWIGSSQVIVPEAIIQDVADLRSVAKIALLQADPLPRPSVDLFGRFMSQDGWIVRLQSYLTLDGQHTSPGMAENFCTTESASVVDTCSHFSIADIYVVSAAWLEILCATLRRDEATFLGIGKVSPAVRQCMVAMCLRVLTGLNGIALKNDGVVSVLADTHFDGEAVVARSLEEFLLRNRNAILGVLAARNSKALCADDANVFTELERVYTKEEREQLRSVLALYVYAEAAKEHQRCMRLVESRGRVDSAPVLAAKVNLCLQYGTFFSLAFGEKGNSSVDD